MGELKTLKDLKKPEIKLELLNKDKLVSRIELKQEAIKWIKELEGGKISNSSYWCYDCNEDCRVMVGRYEVIREECQFHNTFDSDFGAGTEVITSWIKHFFNITEEELK